MGAEFSPRKGSLGAQWGARSSTWRHWTSHLWAWGGWALGTAEGQGQGQGEEGTGRQTNEAQGAQRQPGHQEAVDTD